MLSLFAFGFATIRAEEIPAGVMPQMQRRQVAGTGVSTTTTADSTSVSSADPTTTTDAAPTSTTDTPTTSDTPTSDTAVTTSAADPTTTSDAVPTTTSNASVSQDSTTAVAPATTTSDDSTSAAQSTTDASAPSSSVSADPTSSDSSAIAASSTADSSTADSSTADSSSAVSSQAQSSTEIKTTVAVTTTNAKGSTITTSVKTSTLAAVAAEQTQSSGIVRTETGKASNLVVFGSSTINRSTLSSATVITSALIAEETEQSTYTSYWTTDGTTGSSVITTDRVYQSTTGYATATISPSLRNGGGSGSNLSTSSKSIIGGVVGGIGGAILIGGIALVCWRLWGKKKHREQIPQDDFLDSRNDSISREKRASGAPLPEQYHNPNGAVNTASNF